MPKSELAGKGIDEFINPKSMVTPGVVGGLTMTISNSLYVAFGAPAAVTTAIVSLLFAMVVFRARRIPVWQRGIFYVLNSLIIFSVAFGTNAAGSSGGKENESEDVPKHITRPLPAPLVLTNNRTVVRTQHLLITTNNPTFSNTVPKTADADGNKLKRRKTFFHSW